MNITKYKIAFIEPAPNWHHPELYEKISLHSRIELFVYFFSKESLNGKLLSEAFGIKRKSWGVDLLKGYNYKFLKNYSPRKPAFMKTKIFSYLNLGIWNEIKKSDYHAVVITMWNDISYLTAAIACKYYKKPFFWVGDSTILTDQTKHKLKLRTKRFILGRIFFPMSSGFLYRNEMNLQFYWNYGVQNERLFFYPLSVDHNELSQIYSSLHAKKVRLRIEAALRPKAFIVLFVGRLSNEKCPMDLINAFEGVKAKNKILLIVGDGKLRPLIEETIRIKDKLNILFIGFKTRNEVLKFYALSDVLVLPSSHEPHGDVVKEAMCFGLPVIVSDKVGASADLVKHNENGFVYPCGDTGKLASFIDELSDKNKRESFSQKSLEIIRDWDHDKAVEGLVAALDFIHQE